MSVHSLPLLLSFLVCAAAFAGDMAPPPPEEHPVLGEIAQAMDPTQLQSTLTTLVGFGTRSTLSDTKSSKRGIGAARRWVQSRFEQMSKDCGGCLTVITPSQVFTGERTPKDGVEVMDVVAIQK